jgi:hypothetical protein
MANTTVRMFGELRDLRRRNGLPDTVEMDLPAEGLAAGEIACSLGLPLNQIEGVFVNHRVYGLNRVVMPGDATAFVPPGTPGPHRVFLGLYQAGKSSASRSD